jgi:hypothetical protein
MNLTDQMAITQLVNSGQFNSDELSRLLAEMIDQYNTQYQQQQMSKQYQQQPVQQQQGQSPMQAYDTYNSVMDMMGGGTGAGGATAGGEGSMMSGAMPSGTADTGWLSSLGDMFSGGGGETASSAGYGTLGYILAAIAGQHLASDATSRHTPLPGVEGRGHKTGDVFSMDFFNEPWQSYLYDQLDMKSTVPGEKTDAAINALRDGESTWDNLLRSAPATGAQWFDPFSSVGYDIMNEKGGTIGKYASKALFPIQWLTRLFD